MIIRVYALYGRSARVLWWLIGIATCLTALAVVGVEAIPRSDKINRFSVGRGGRPAWTFHHRILGMSFVHRSIRVSPAQPLLAAASADKPHSSYRL
jgi:hypothetical protein